MSKYYPFYLTFPTSHKQYPSNLPLKKITLALPLLFSHPITGKKASRIPSTIRSLAGALIPFRPDWFICDRNNDRGNVPLASNKTPRLFNPPPRKREGEAETSLISRISRVSGPEILSADSARVGHKSGKSLLKIPGARAVRPDSP